MHVHCRCLTAIVGLTTSPYRRSEVLVPVSQVLVLASLVLILVLVLVGLILVPVLAHPVLEHHRL